jgi:hypothetical protein
MECIPLCCDVFFFFYYFFFFFLLFLFFFSFSSSYSSSSSSSSSSSGVLQLMLPEEPQFYGLLYCPRIGPSNFLHQLHAATPPKQTKLEL